jgi:hypothetical protein
MRKKIEKDQWMVYLAILAMLAALTAAVWSG